MAEDTLWFCAASAELAGNLLGLLMARGGVGLRAVRFKARPVVERSLDPVKERSSAGGLCKVVAICVFVHHAPVVIASVIRRSLVLEGLRRAAVHLVHHVSLLLESLVEGHLLLLRHGAVRREAASVLAIIVRTATVVATAVLSDVGVV